MHLYPKKLFVDLDENGLDIGANERYTEDGYAKIVLASLEDPEADDGDESLDDATAKLVKGK